MSYMDFIKLFLQAFPISIAIGLIAGVVFNIINRGTKGLSPKELEQLRVKTRTFVTCVSLLVFATLSVIGIVSNV